jgi:hypothetical protein
MTKQEKLRMIALKLSHHQQKYNTILTDKERAYFGFYDKTDNSANGLTRCCIDFLTFNGHQAEKITTMGRRIDKTKVVTDILGHKKTIGSVEWQRGTGTKGSADISATIKPQWAKFGISVKIEIKYKKDRQSDDQKKYEQTINQAGGIYIIVRTIGDLMQWYDEFISNPIE